VGQHGVGPGDQRGAVGQAGQCVAHRRSVALKGTGRVAADRDQREQEQRKQLPAVGHDDRHERGQPDKGHVHGELEGDVLADGLQQRSVSQQREGAPDQPVVDTEVGERSGAEDQQVAPRGGCGPRRQPGETAEGQQPPRRQQAERVLAEVEAGAPPLVAVDDAGDDGCEGLDGYRAGQPEEQQGSEAEHRRHRDARGVRPTRREDRAQLADEHQGEDRPEGRSVGELVEVAARRSEEDQSEDGDAQQPDTDQEAPGGETAYGERGMATVVSVRHQSPPLCRVDECTQSTRTR
jgi:hypothetical protein